MTDQPTAEEPTAEELFAANLRRFREHLGWSQSDLAKLMSAQGFRWHPATVYSVEKGERRIPLNEVVTIARLLHVSVDSLLRPDKDTEYRILADRLYESFKLVAEELIDTAESYEIERRQMRGITADRRKRGLLEERSLTQIAIQHLLNLSAAQLVDPETGKARDNAIDAIRRIGSDRQQAQQQAGRARRVRRDNV